MVSSTLDCRCMSAYTTPWISNIGISVPGPSLDGPRVSIARSARSGSDQSRVSMRSETDWGALAASEAPTANNPMTEISAYLRIVAARFIANGALLSCFLNHCRDGHHPRGVGFSMFMLIGGGCDGRPICSGCEARFGHRYIRGAPVLPC